VSFGDAENFVDRRDPFASHSLLSEHGGERLAQRDVEAPGLQEKSFRSLRVDLGKAQKLGAALGGDNVCHAQEADQPFPGKFDVWRGRVDKINRQPPGEQRKVRSGAWQAGEPPARGLATQSINQLGRDNQ